MASITSQLLLIEMCIQKKKHGVIDLSIVDNCFKIKFENNVQYNIKKYKHNVPS